jgi:undecaprenyl-diphosphatase
LNLPISDDMIAAAFLGIVQGLTEFLPVSSTAHLILVTDVLKLDPVRYGLAFDVALHLGTALAVLIYFAGTWIGLLLGLFRGRWRLPLLLAIGTLPAAIAGYFLQAMVERTLRTPLVIVVGLVVGSVIFVVAERIAHQRRYVDELGVRDALFMGIAQAIALVPGISRSGITISAGLVRDLHREEATRFSFLLATPVIVGAGLKTLLDTRTLNELLTVPQLVLIGFAASFLSGYVAVAFMMSFLRTHPLTFFVFYRVALAGLVVALVLAKAL